MTFKLPFRNSGAICALALALTGLGVPSAARAATLPRLEADSLGGSHVVLPADAAGTPLVLLLAFTPESEADLKAWSRAFIDRHDLTMYVVVIADRQAFMSRRHIRSLVEGAAVGTRDQIERNVLVTFSGAGWQSLVAPGDKRVAGVVACDANGDVTFAQRLGFSDAHLADVEHALK